MSTHDAAGDNARHKQRSIDSDHPPLTARVTPIPPTADNLRAAIRSRIGSNGAGKLKRHELRRCTARLAPGAPQHAHRPEIAAQILTIVAEEYAGKIDLRTPDEFADKGLYRDELHALLRALARNDGDVLDGTGGERDGN